MKTAIIKLIVVTFVLTFVSPVTTITAQTLGCGNIDGDPGGSIDLGDYTAFFDYFFISHTEPASMEAADMDGCAGVDIGDFLAFLDYYFSLLFWPPPPSCATVECPLTPGGSVTLDHVNSLLQPGVLMAGIPETHFYLRVTNDSTGHRAITNGFRLFSPDGATWESIDAEIVDSGLASSEKYAKVLGDDGQGADTVGFCIWKMEYGGSVLPPNYDAVIYKISIGPIDPVHDGKTIVLDTSFFQPWGTWKWTPNESPTWDGPHYFTIVCCVGLTGNVDGDPEDIVDLGDLTKLIDYLFISFEEPGCMKEANIDGDEDGLVDLGDLTALIDFLFISFTPPAACL